MLRKEAVDVEIAEEVEDVVEIIVEEAEIVETKEIN